MKTGTSHDSTRMVRMLRGGVPLQLNDSTLHPVSAVGESASRRRVDRGVQRELPSAYQYQCRVEGRSKRKVGGRSIGYCNTSFMSVWVLTFCEKNSFPLTFFIAMRMTRKNATLSRPNKMSRTHCVCDGVAIKSYTPHPAYPERRGAQGQHDFTT